MKKKESIHRNVNSYDMEKEVACAAQVEAFLKKSGIAMTGSFGLLLKLLRIPEINLVLNAKLIEYISMFHNEVNEFLNTQE